MKLLNATFSTDTNRILVLHRDGAAVQAAIGGKVFRFFAADLNETDLPQEVWTYLRALAGEIYGTDKKGAPRCTGSMLRDLRNQLENFI